MFYECWGAALATKKKDIYVSVSSHGYMCTKLLLGLYSRGLGPARAHSQSVQSVLDLQQDPPDNISSNCGMEFVLFLSSLNLTDFDIK